MTTPTAPSADATPLTDEQIDRAVALDVMHWFPDDDCPRGYRPSWSINQGQNDGPHYEEWQPSTSIADAFQVLEKFPFPDHAVNIFTSSTGEWVCQIEGRDARNDYRWSEWRAEADTAPRAICLAALAATEQVQA